MRLPNHKTKIVCTIGSASRSETVMEQLMLQGMNVARLNFAHGTRQGHREDIRLQHHCLIMVGLPGPKIRIGQLLEESLLLEKGDEADLPSYFRVAAGAGKATVEDLGRGGSV